MAAFHNNAIPTRASIAPFGPPPVTRRVGVAPPPNRERAFAKAKRRSARVRLLRHAILIGGLGAVAALVVAAFFNPFATRLGSLDLGALSVEGTKIVMERPKLAGFRSDGQPYTLTAVRALQDIKHPTVAELEKVTGEIGMAGGRPARLSADAGVYDSVSERMDLSKNVRIENDQFTVLLRSARFDFKSGVYQSDEPVEVQAGAGETIFADRASAAHNGQELTFEGHVRTKIVPQAGGEPAADPIRTNP